METGDGWSGAHSTPEVLWCAEMRNLFLLLFVFPALQDHGPAQDPVLRVAIQAPKRRFRSPNAFGPYKPQKFL